jgi:hypothetical protein
MADENIKLALRALATEKEISNFQRMKNLLPDIEAALEAGATRKAVIATLKSEGLDIAPDTFSVYMGRLKNTPPFEAIPPDTTK